MSVEKKKNCKVCRNGEGLSPGETCDICKRKKAVGYVVGSSGIFLDNREVQNNLPVCKEEKE